MKIRILGMLLALALLSGCSSFGSRYDNAQDTLIDSARNYVKAADDALPEHPDEAKRYVGWARDVLGDPSEELSNDDLLKRHQRDEKVLREREEAEKHLIELGKQKEAENNSNLVKKIWHWAVGSFGLLGGIAFLVCCPSIAIPLGLKLLGWLVNTVLSLIPSLVHFIGVVGKATFENVVKGVNRTREELKAAEQHTPEKTYTAAEVRKMLDTHLAIETDQKDKTLIDQIKEKI